MEQVKKKNSKYDNIAYLFLLPNYLIFFIFLLIPIIWTIAMSFTDYNLTDFQFIGLRNYSVLLQDKVFLKSLSNTLIYCIVTIPAAKGIAQPWICPPLAVGQQGIEDDVQPAVFVHFHFTANHVFRPMPLIVHNGLTLRVFPSDCGLDFFFNGVI